jgi:hypothetical protein
MAAQQQGRSGLKYKNQGTAKIREKKRKKYDTDRALSSDLRVPPGCECELSGEDPKQPFPSRFDKSIACGDGDYMD